LNICNDTEENLNNITENRNVIEALLII